MLDVLFTVNKDGSWTLAGKDMSKLTSTGWYFNAGVYDYNTNSDKELFVDIMWTVAPSQMPAITLKDIVPVEAANAVDSIINDENHYEYASMDTTEFKGYNESTN